MESSVLLETYAQLPFTLERGQGVWVYDEQNRRYLDFYGGHAVAILGHCPPALAAALFEQAQKLHFYSNISPLTLRAKAAERLAKFVYPEFGHMFFCNSGAEANENALKLALRITGRDRLVAFKGGFHGRSFLASALTDNSKWHQDLGTWFSSERVSFLRPNELLDLSQIDKQTAAVILEPIQSIAGVVSFETAYLQKLRQRCGEVGALLIFDEIQTGMGRVGWPTVAGFSGVCPDICTLAKGVGGGFPLGVLLVNDKLAALVKSGDLGSTFGGGPLAMAALNATLEEIERQGLLQNALRIETWVREHVRVKEVLEVRGRGCLLGLRLSCEAKRVNQALLEQGIICGTSNDPNVLRLLPPLILEEQHVAMLAQGLRTVFAR